MPDRSKPDGILKTEIKELVDRRKEVKNLMRRVSCDSDLYKQVEMMAFLLRLFPHFILCFSTMFANWD